MEYLFDADKPHFATWLWIYNEDRKSRSLSAMRPGEPEAVPLYYAARLGFCEVAERLIAEHPEHVNARGRSRVIPMHAAAEAGQADIVSLLIQHGADVNGRGNYGETPLFAASVNGRLEAGKILLDHGADIDARNEYNNTALIYAIILGKIEFARMLLEREGGGVVINARCQDDETPASLGSKRRKDPICAIATGAPREHQRA